MVTDADTFWSGPQGAAKFKHAVVKGQVGAFAGKLGHSRGGTVSYIDGYAGPGAYGDGTPGSPMIVLDIADELSAAKRPIRVQAQFIERNKDYCERLRRLLDDRGYSHWPVHQGDCRKQLGQALQQVQDDPLLVFLDPFGLGIPFNQLVEEVLHRDDGTARRRPTEVVANFSVSALNRLGGFLDADFDHLGRLEGIDLFGEGEATPTRSEAEIERLKRQQQAHLSNMDEFLGGDWWRTIPHQGTELDLPRVAEMAGAHTRSCSELARNGCPGFRQVGWPRCVLPGFANYEFSWLLGIQRRSVQGT